MRIHIIRANGTEEYVDRPFYSVAQMIGANVLDWVTLRDGRVMAVDDQGYETEAVKRGEGHYELKPVRATKPVNAKATALYWSICKPGTTHQIVGDVAIVVDDEVTTEDE